jgi:peptide/nickel transport system permease protein
LTYRGTDVLKLIGPALGPTLLLAGLAFFVAIALAIPLGILAATHRESPVDYAVNVLAALGLALPSFWLGLLLIIVFGIQLRWLPTSGYPSGGSNGGPLDVPRYVLLPAAVLVTGLLAPLARQMRSSMLEELNQDYLRTAHAKGIGANFVLYRHALKNALFPVITLMGTQIPLLIGGSAIIESLFAWPGMGRLAVSSAFERDYPTVLAITIIIATIAILSGLVVDLLYVWLDPRVRLARHESA